ncbi:MAG: DUF885 domain-containing protein, partial [Gammaproteobacteria bacterium]
MQQVRLALVVGLMLASLEALTDVVVRDPAVAQLNQLFEDAWDQDMRESPVWASMLGDRRFNREWSDSSEEARARRRAAYSSALKRLAAIDREVLPADELVNYELFGDTYRDRLEAMEYRTDLIPISQRGGIQTLDETGNRLRMESVQDYEDWLARLGKVDALMDQTIERMKEGVRQGMVPPKITMSRVPAQIEKQIVATPEQSLFYKPFQQLPSHWSPVERERIRSEAKAVIAEVVVPAYQRLYDYFTESYLPACADDIGASSLPNGKAFYEYRVRRFTTTNMTPDEVHEIGLAEVARIRAEMKQVMNEVNFEGTLAEFFTFLREDPQFYFEDPMALLKEYQAVSKQIDPKMVQLFTKLPRMPYGIKVIPEAVAPDTTTAYYSRPAADGSRPGYYWVNLYEPRSRPKFEIEVLTVHEAVPGHHLQIALQQELESLPNFRRYSGYTVFTEGWGLYSERLGYDIGLYQDPYSKFGQLSYDMWRAVRLVVDTGMHYKGWTRDQAIEFFIDNAPRKRLDIVNEIDRYISWPGQALAYKVGQLSISSLRE